MHERLTEPCTFIIDDWQYVNAVTEVRGLWNQILRDAPPTCRFVFASRVKPRLQFARFKTHSGYASSDRCLRFTESEIAELFRDIYNDPLESGDSPSSSGGPRVGRPPSSSSRSPCGTILAGARRDFIESITATSTATYSTSWPRRCSTSSPR